MKEVSISAGATNGTDAHNCDGVEYTNCAYLPESPDCDYDSTCDNVSDKDNDAADASMDNIADAISDYKHISSHKYELKRQATPLNLLLIRYFDSYC